ncbi:MAG: biotin/lipoyl-containing protein, partial [Flexibacteraceae bacterium]
MAEIIRMPKMSDTMTEGTIAAWHKQVGDKVKSGDIIAEVETDKATMELDNYVDGVLLHIGIKAGESIPVDGVIAIIGKEGEDISALLSGGSAPVATATPVAQAVSEAPLASAPKVDTSNIKAEVIRMPKMSDTMTEGIIANWLKKVGDKVKAGDILAEVETDKATMELDNYVDGTLLYIGVEAGKAIAVDGIIAIIGEAGADFNALLNAGSSAPAQAAAVSTPSVSSAPAAVNSPVAVTPTATHSSDEHLKASPLAKKLA